MKTLLKKFTETNKPYHLNNYSLYLGALIYTLKRFIH